jgi:hypothetical protein
VRWTVGRSGASCSARRSYGCEATGPPAAAARSPRAQQRVPGLGGEERLAGAGQQIGALGQQRGCLGGNRPGALPEQLGQGAHVGLDPGSARGEGHVELGSLIERAILGGARIVLAPTRTEGLRGAQPAPGRLGAHLPLGTGGLETTQGHPVAGGLQPGHVTAVGRMEGIAL